MKKPAVDVTTEVLQAFYPGQKVEAKLLSGGEVNGNFVVTDQAGQRSVLQKVSPIFDSIMAEDYDVFSHHLRSHGWEVPEALLSIENSWYFKDGSGKLWRAFSFIDSDGTPSVEYSTLHQAGALLAKLHESLAHLDYTPKFSLPHFHETSYYAEHLQKLKTHLPRNEQKQLADKTLLAFKTLPELTKTDKQLIHGDPRTANMLFRDGKPFTFIDFDTVMLGSIWLDIGDLGRSLIEDVIDSDNAQVRDIIHQLSQGYQYIAKFDTDEKNVLQQVISAVQQIALELTMRFLIDIVEDYYFVWDTKNFTNRKEYNWSRANTQWRIYEKLARLK